MPVNTRTAHQTTVLPVGGGSDGQSPVLVRRGENIAYCVYAMHRRKDLYGQDAEDFRPERWEDKDLPLYRNSVRAAWGYLPFSGGPRVCLGRKLNMGWKFQGVVFFFFSSLLISPLKNDLEDFSLVEASYTLVRILQEFPTIKAGSFERSQSQTWLGYSSHHSEGVKKTTKERQRMTLVISAGDGCPVVCG